MKNSLRAIYLDSNPKTGVNWFAVEIEDQETFEKFQRARGEHACTVKDPESKYFGFAKYSTKFKCMDFNLGFSESGKIIHLGDETDKLVWLVNNYEGAVADKLADRVADLIFKQHTKKTSVAPPPTQEEFVPNENEADLED